MELKGKTQKVMVSRLKPVILALFPNVTTIIINTKGFFDINELLSMLQKHCKGKKIVIKIMGDRANDIEFEPNTSKESLHNRYREVSRLYFSYKEVKRWDQSNFKYRISFDTITKESTSAGEYVVDLLSIEVDTR